MKNIILTCLISLFTFAASAETSIPNIIDELNPRDPQIRQILIQLDKNYEAETGLSSRLPEDLTAEKCFRETCKVWVRINRAEQRFYLYIDAIQTYEWLTSTGSPDSPEFITPAMDTHPDGRIYDAYTSTLYPEGDYMGLGNMPYAVFVKDGWAIHGTPEGNWPLLGSPVSAGCIRLHPDNAFIFNRLVREWGRRKVWVTIE
ncbi:MAG: L,D-transpeptidase [Bdellovibrionota bacterium]